MLCINNFSEHIKHKTGIRMYRQVVCNNYVLHFTFLLSCLMSDNVKVFLCIANFLFSIQHCVFPDLFVSVGSVVVQFHLPYQVPFRRLVRDRNNHSVSTMTMRYIVVATVAYGAI